MIRVIERFDNHPATRETIAQIGDLFASVRHTLIASSALHHSLLGQGPAPAGWTNMECPRCGRDSYECWPEWSRGKQCELRKMARA